MPNLVPDRPESAPRRLEALAVSPKQPPPPYLENGSSTPLSMPEGPHRTHQALERALFAILVWRDTSQGVRCLYEWRVRALRGYRSVVQMNRLKAALEAKRIGAVLEIEGECKEHTLTRLLRFEDPVVEAAYAKQRHPTQAVTLVAILFSAAFAAVLSLVHGAEATATVPCLAIFLLGALGILLTDANGALGRICGDLTGWHGVTTTSVVEPELGLEAKPPAWSDAEATRPPSVAVLKGEELQKDPVGQAPAGPATLPRQDWQHKPSSVSRSETVTWQGLYEACSKKVWCDQPPLVVVEYAAPALLAAGCLWGAYMTSAEQNPAHWCGLLTVTVVPMLSSLPLEMATAVAVAVCAAAGFGWRGSTAIGHAFQVMLCVWFAFVAYFAPWDWRSIWAERHMAIAKLESMESRQCSLSAEVNSHVPLTALLGDASAGSAKVHNEVMVVVVEVVPGLDQPPAVVGSMEPALENVHSAFVQLDYALWQAALKGLKITKVGTSGSRYIACVGLEGPQGPIEEVVPPVAELCRNMLQRCHGLASVGIHSGTLMSTVGVNFLPMLNITGSALNIATVLSTEAAPGTMAFTEGVAGAMGFPLDTLKTGGTVLVAGITYNVFTLACTTVPPPQLSSPLQHLHELSADIVSVQTEGKGIVASSSRRKALQREAKAQWERGSGLTPACDAGCKWSDIGRGWFLCKKEMIGYWMYNRWRTRSTLAMVAAATLNLVVVVVHMVNYYHDQPDSGHLWVLCAHIVLSVLLLCSAVTAQTLLYFRSHTAQPAYLAAVGTTIVVTPVMLALVALAPSSDPRDIEAVLVFCVLQHIHGVAVVSMDRGLMILFQLVIALVVLWVMGGGDEGNVLRMVACCMCSMDTEALTQEVKTAEAHMLALYPVALHRALPKVSTAVVPSMEGAVKVNSMSVLVVELLVESSELDSTGRVQLLPPPVEAMLAVHHLYGNFTDAAHEVEAEKVQTKWNVFYAMAGAPVPYLGSHTTAMVVLGMKIINHVRKYRHFNPTGPKLVVKVGTGSGGGVGAVMGGETHLRFDLFGEAVDIAERMARMAKPEAIQVDQRTFSILNMAHLKENYKFALKALGQTHSFTPDVQDLGIKVTLAMDDELESTDAENANTGEESVRPAASTS